MNDGTDIRVTLLINEDGALRKYGLNVPLSAERTVSMRPDEWTDLAHTLGKAIEDTLLRVALDDRGGVPLPRILEGAEYPSGLGNL